MKASIAPFYVGQKVVYVGPSNNGYKNNEVYVVAGIKSLCCGWSVSVGIPVPAGMVVRCSPHNCDYTINGCIGLTDTLHRPVQTFPLIKLSEIRVKEQEEVLCDN